MRIPTILFMLSLALGSSCGFKEPQTFGKKIDTTGALIVNKAFALNGLNRRCTVKGRVTEVCQNEGCWFNIEGSNGDKVMLSFDKLFTVPKDIAGKQAVGVGVFYNDTTRIEELKSIAKDDGQAQNAIDTIKTPKIELKFLPEGVMIY